MKKMLTVFTPTYNRADLLSCAYEALQRQTSSNFKWLVIDDGSTDNTKDVVESWIKENKIDITYVYKENGGLHTGYNKAIELLDTELCVCVDSDDYLFDNAVETICEEWAIYKDENIAGLVGYDCALDGNILTGRWSEGKISHYVTMKQKTKFHGDDKIVMKVRLLKQVYPQPTIEGEKNFNPIWLILKLDQLAPFAFIDKKICWVNYQNTGMAANIVKQYFNSPQSFMELRKLQVNLKYVGLPFKLRNYIHLIAEAKIAKKNIFKESVNVWMIVLLYPLGMLLYFYLLKLKHDER